MTCLVQWRVRTGILDRAMRMRNRTNQWQFRLGYHTKAIQAQRASIIATNGFIGLALAVVFLGTSLYVTHRMLRPLNSLTRAVSEMERGNLDVSLPETGTDELGQLVAGFSAMVGSIKERDARSRNTSDRSRSPAQSWRCGSSSAPPSCTRARRAPARSSSMRPTPSSRGRRGRIDGSTRPRRACSATPPTR